MFDHQSKRGEWQLSLASVRGKAHVDHNLPNQDSVSVYSNNSGDVICAVVSDGAGTASRSGEGSKVSAQFIAERMCQIGNQLVNGQDVLNTIRFEFEASINLVRQKIDPSGNHLRDFHCTMVAWLFTPIGAFIAQIGDSVALSTRFAGVVDEGITKVDFFPENGYHLHEVERGEYANETHFITEADWKKHLRISQLPQEIEGIVLMTDGAMDIAMLKGKVYRGFLSNLLGKLINTIDSQARNETIYSWLDDKQTYGVTGDDKTIFSAIRIRNSSIIQLPVFQGTVQTNTQQLVSKKLQQDENVEKNISARIGVADSRLNSQYVKPQKAPANSNQNLTTPRNPLFVPFVATLSALVLTLCGLAYLLIPDIGKFAKISRSEPPAIPDKSRSQNPITSIPASSTLPPDVVPVVPVTTSASQEQLPRTTVDNNVNGRNLIESRISVKPNGVVEFNKDGALLTLSWKAGPDLKINEFKYNKEELKFQAVSNQCKPNTVLNASKKSCKLSVTATATESGNVFLMTIILQPVSGNKELITKIISFRSNSAAAAPGKGKVLNSVLANSPAANVE